MCNLRQNSKRKILEKFAEEIGCTIEGDYLIKDGHKSKITNKNHSIIYGGNDMKTKFKYAGETVKLASSKLGLDELINSAKQQCMHEADELHKQIFEDGEETKEQKDAKEAFEYAKSIVRNDDDPR